MKIKRYLFKVITQHLKAKEITVVTGARQVGKTTLIREIQSVIEAQGEKTLYLNLDYEPDLKYLESQELFIRKIKLEFGNSFGYVFIDEIQRKNNAGLFLKGLFDKSLQVKFVVTGSGSMELKANIHESLAGRKRIFELFPVSFDEFVNFKTDYKYTHNLLQFYSIEPEKTHRLLSEYMNFGGYPRIITEVLQKEKVYLMNEIFNSYIFKDVTYLLNIDRPEAYKKMMTLLGWQTGMPLNYSNLANDSGISVPTIKKYLWFLENTFIIKEIKPFYRNKRKEITKAAVVYFNDLGFRNFLLNHFDSFTSNDKGMIFENFVFNQLYEFKISTLLGEIHYWRTTSQAEVDFVLRISDGIIPIEVKYSHLKTTSLTRSFSSFLEKYQPSNAIIVNISLSETKKVGNSLVEFIPFYKLPSVLNRISKE